MLQNAFVGDNTQHRRGGQLGILDLINKKYPNYCFKTKEKRSVTICCIKLIQKNLFFENSEDLLRQLKQSQLSYYD